jgi:hypothetical protein
VTGGGGMKQGEDFKEEEVKGDFKEETKEDISEDTSKAACFFLLGQKGKELLKTPCEVQDCCSWPGGWTK